MDTTDTGGDSSLAQATYVQKKLEAFYYKTYARLYRYRNALQILQEVLIWRRASITLLLYVVIHGLFVYLVQDSKMTALSLIGNGIFWSLIIDAITRAALRDGRGLSAQTVKYESQHKPVAFDKAMAEMSKPKELQQLQSFEIFCLQVAKVWVWVDNLRLASCYWFFNEPLTFAALLAILGFVLSVVGKLVPTIVIMYIAVMAAVVIPFMEFYEQRKKLSDFLDTNCPRFTQQMRRLLSLVQNLRLPSNDDIDSLELSLDIGGDSKTQETLTAEFLQAMVPRGGTKQPVVALVTPVVASAPPLQLDDSFVGTPFSSVSNLDNSLNLPSFTPQMLEQEQHNRRNRLDPFTDSLDISFGSNFTDGGQRPRGLARVDEAEEDSSPSHHYTAEGRPPPPPYYAPRNRRHLANK